MAGHITVTLSFLEAKSLLNLTHVNSPFSDKQRRAVDRAARKLRKGIETLTALDHVTPFTYQDEGR